jgi:hypothetical protein
VRRRILQLAISKVKIKLGEGEKFLAVENFAGPVVAERRRQG